MKRGIIRIISGSIMILFQVLAIIGQISRNGHTPSIAWNNLASCLYSIGNCIGFYGVGISGIVLLAFGINAYKKGLRSHIILHTRSGKFHTAIKWVMFAVTALVCVDNLTTFIQNFNDFNIDTLLIFFATLSFAIYLLFYVYKKPSCLLSTCLILMGVAYLYNTLSNIPYYLIYAEELDSWAVILIFKIFPKLIASILYIVLATKLYKENFAVISVKVLSWIAVAMELLSEIVFPAIVGIHLYNLNNILYILFILGLLLYISAFKINTLKQPEFCNVKFCRKCGNILLNDSKFCNKCGTEVIKNIGEQDNEM